MEKATKKWRANDGIIVDFMGFYGILWDDLGFYGILWDDLGFYGILWDMNNHLEVP